MKRRLTAEEPPAHEDFSVGLLHRDHAAVEALHHALGGDEGSEEDEDKTELGNFVHVSERKETGRIAASCR